MGQQHEGGKALCREHPVSVWRITSVDYVCGTENSHLEHSSDDRGSKSSSRTEARIETGSNRMDVTKQQKQVKERFEENRSSIGAHLGHVGVSELIREVERPQLLLRYEGQTEVRPVHGRARSERGGKSRDVHVVRAKTKPSKTGPRDGSRHDGGMPTIEAESR